MKKGKFGVVLCFYPILAFICVILKLHLIWPVLAVVLFVEKDEWAGRQTLQASMLFLLMSLFTEIAPWGAGLFPIPFLAKILTAVASVLSVIAYLASIVFSILAITRVMKEREADLPVFGPLSYRIYGKQSPRPVMPQPQYYPQQAAQPIQPMQPVVPQQAQPAASQPAASQPVQAPQPQPGEEPPRQ